MPRHKAKVRALFTSVSEGPVAKTPKVKCKFCRWTGADNGTRMAEHIENCSQCPGDVRTRYISIPTSDNIVNMPRLPPKAQKETNTEVEQTQATSSASSRLSSSESLPHNSPLSSAEPHIDMKPRCSMKNTCAAKHCTSMTGTMAFFVDKLTEAEKEDIDELLARAIFASGTPLSVTENKYWKELFSKMRPAYLPPSRYVLTTRLLDAEHSRLLDQVSQKVANAEILALMCDGWSNCRNEAIVNFVVTTPEPVFYKSLPTEKNRHTGKYMADIMRNVLDEIGPDRFLGVVTDNASNMKKAWEELQKLYPHLSCYGCIAHGLQLLLTDIGKLDTVKDIIARAKVVIKEVRNIHILAAVFKEHAKCALRLPVATRWGSTITCLQSMLKNKPALRRLAVDENAESHISAECKSTILNDVFWDRQQALFDLLSPVATWITKLEADTPMLGVVVKVFSELTQHFDAALSKSPLLIREEQAARTALCNRREFCLTDIHKAANLLDPRYCGEDLSEEELVDASQFIFNTANQMHVDGPEAMTDLAEYQAKHGLWSKEFVWASAKHVLPHVWWSGVCSRRPLSIIASRILNMPASSAACERTFSAYGNIHTAKRNRLTNETAGKLVYVYQNLRAGTDTEANQNGQPNTKSSETVAAADGVDHTSLTSEDDDDDEEMSDEDEEDEED